MSALVADPVFLEVMIGLALAIVGIGFLAIAGGFSLWMVGRCFNAVAEAANTLTQTTAFARAAEVQARSQREVDTAFDRSPLNRPNAVDRPTAPSPDVDTYDDRELAAAARAGRASTGVPFIPGYDAPPPSAAENDGRAYIGDEVDGDRDPEQIREGGNGVYAGRDR